MACIAALFMKKCHSSFSYDFLHSERAVPLRVSRAYRRLAEPCVIYGTLSYSFHFLQSFYCRTDAAGLIRCPINQSDLFMVYAISFVREASNIFTPSTSTASLVEHSNVLCISCNMHRRLPWIIVQVIIISIVPSLTSCALSNYLT